MKISVITHSVLLKSLLLCLLLGTVVLAQTTYPKREFRGAWVATVANIDYPSSGQASTETKIAELKLIFDRLKSAGITSVFFQVRSECDAMYASTVEPWSYWLTGKQGKAPEPFFDPLQIAIEEAHKKGMELHAWLNPFRATKTVGEYEIDDKHVTRQHPEWILSFRDLRMLDPGNPQARQYILSVIADIVNRYNVDGIHFDDYFYPYGPHVTKEDAESFRLYRKNFASVEDWRRNNINQFIHDAAELIHSAKPYLKFGVSPFGILENKYAGTNGFEAYHILYSDPVAWLRDKSVDYILPQIYWEIGHQKADFAKLLPWWGSIGNGRHVYIGHFASSYLSPKYAGAPGELQEQIKLVRANSHVLGSAFFSAKTIFQNWKNFGDTLAYKTYLYPALQPAMPWRDSIPPNASPKGTATIVGDQIQLSWDAPPTAADGEDAAGYVVYKFLAGADINLNDSRAIRAILPATQRSYSEYAGFSDYIYIITVLDRLQNESTGLLLKVIR